MPQPGAPPPLIGRLQQIWNSVVFSSSRLYSAWRTPVPGAHHLDVAGRGAAFVAQRVLVGDGAGADIGDDLHVACGCGGKPDLGAIWSSFHTRIGPQPMLSGS